jgi:hypothetical protein
MRGVEAAYVGQYFGQSAVSEAAYLRGGDDGDVGGRIAKALLLEAGCLDLHVQQLLEREIGQRSRSGAGDLRAADPHQEDQGQKQAPHDTLIGQGARCVTSFLRRGAARGT